MSATIIAALITSSITLLTVVISAMVTVLSWKRSLCNQLKQQQYAAELVYVTRQIEELYGPLFGLIVKYEAVKKVYRKVLPEDSKDEHFQTIWLFFRENYIYPLGSKQAKLIISKQHLLLNNTMPHCFKAFLDHQAMRDTLLPMWKSEGISSSKKCISSGYPEEELMQHVKSSLEGLQAKYHDLIVKTTS